MYRFKGKTKSLSGKLLVLTVSCLFVFLSFSQISISTKIKEEIGEEVHLLRSEHYLYLRAKENVSKFNFRYTFPPDYGSQVPILIEVHNDSTVNLINYEITKDKMEPNRLANFTIGEMKIDEIKLIHFSFWVLVKNNDFSDMPSFKLFPRRLNLPEETKIWLSRSNVVQTLNVVLRDKAKDLKAPKINMINYADDVAKYVKRHRFFSSLIQNNFGIYFFQDAFSTLILGGKDTGRSHLACAFLRINNIPARVILVNKQDCWTQMQYMVEYYIPDYGWVLLDPMSADSSSETKNQIINRICHPEDEKNTTRDHITPITRGLERWMWFNSSNIKPYFVDLDEGSKSKMFSEAEIITDSSISDHSILITKMVYHEYEKYIGKNLDCNNYQYFLDAQDYQEEAINQLKYSDDIYEYIYYMQLAYDSYQQIEI